MTWYPAFTEEGTTDEVNERVMSYVRKMKRENMEFDDFRTAGRCPNCKAQPLISFTINPSITIQNGVPHEDCGHWCPFCSFSGATYRAIDDR